MFSQASVCSRGWVLRGVGIGGGPSGRYPRGVVIPGGVGIPGE